MACADAFWEKKYVKLLKQKPVNYHRCIQQYTEIYQYRKEVQCLPKYNQTHTRLFLMTSLSSPKASFAEGTVNSGKPWIGAYSLS